jgi:lysophospholipase L1-like esterase
MHLVEEPSAASQKARLPFWKRTLFTLISIFFVFTVMACLGEVVLRILPMGKYRSAPFRQYDPEIGLALVPNRHVIHSRGCFQGEVSINNWGMRDRERTLAKPPGEFRIAMIGDSGVEAVHVKPDEVVNIQMEHMLHDQGYKNIEVMAFGVEGIGTTQELLLYEKKVRQFHPDLVLLMFATNDVFNNSSTLQPKAYGIHEWYAPYYDLAPDGSLVFKPVEPRHFNGLRNFLEVHSVLFYYMERMWLQVDIPLYKWQGMPVFYGTYAADPLDNEWKTAWTITEKVLVRMRDTVNADGAKFVVMPWPDSTDMDPNWRQRMTTQFGRLPDAFVPTMPEDRLREISSRAQVPLVFFTPEMLQYRDQNQLPWPYFSLTCDPHFSALGHRVSAQSIAKELKDHNLLPPVAAQ